MTRQGDGASLDYSPPHASGLHTRDGVNLYGTKKRPSSRAIEGRTAVFQGCVVDIKVSCPAWRKRLPGIVSLTRETVRAALREAGIGQGEISVMLSDDEAMRALNRRWRGKDAPTNVLSFASGEPLLLGDIVLAFETVAREAKEQGKPLAHHVRHLLVHGVLHLLGHDHARPREAARMENCERRILETFAIPDPYAARGGNRG